MRRDPKSGDVFDYIEPPEPKTKGIAYKYVEGMSSDARMLMGSLLMTFTLAVIVTLSILAYNISALIITEGQSAIDRPRVSKSKSGEGK